MSSIESYLSQLEGHVQTGNTGQGKSLLSQLKIALLTSPSGATDNPALAASMSDDPAYDPARPDASRSSAPWRIYNIGCERPVELLRYIEVIEQCTGKRAITRMLPMQPGDVRATCAEMSCRFTPSLWRSVSTIAPIMATSSTSPAIWKKWT